MLHRRYLILAAALLALGVAGHAYNLGDAGLFTQVLLSDDFSSATLDPAKWGTPVGSVGYGGGVVTLNVGGYLSTLGQFQPSAAQPLLIEGDITILSGGYSALSMGVGTRSDGTVYPRGGSNWIEQRTGVSLAILTPGPSYINLFKATSSTWGELTGIVDHGTYPTGNWNGAVLHFRFMDDGTNVSGDFTGISGVSGTNLITGGPDSQAFLTNLISFGGRANGSTALDNVVVKTIPEPGSLLALASGLAGLAGLAVRRGRRR